MPTVGERVKSALPGRRKNEVAVEQGFKLRESVGNGLTKEASRPCKTLER